MRAGSLVADRAEASPAHRSVDPEPPMVASLHCKHPGVRPSWNGAISQTDAQTDAGQIIYRFRLVTNGHPGHDIYRAIRTRCIRVVR